MRAVSAGFAVTAAVVLASLAFASARINVPQDGTFSVTNTGLSAYHINGTDNPVLQVVRGQTYTFNINASGHPFHIKSVQGAGTANDFTNGVTGNGTQVGTLTFVVPGNAPNTLFYNCEFHSAMTNSITVITATPGYTPWVAGASLIVLFASGALALRRRRVTL